MLTTASVKKAPKPSKTVIGKVNEVAEETPPTSDPALAHSRLGPSSSERWLNCLGSVLYTKDMPDKSSIYAAEGTAAHELSEWVREQGKLAKKFIGQVIEVEEWEFEVTQEMADAVQSFVDYCEELEGDGFYEERVHYTAWVPDGWGTADDIRIEDGGTCHVTDLKYGKGVQVWAKDNPQLRLYALGVFQDYGHLYDIKDFHLTIHQPRLGHVDEVSITVKELLLWARDIVAEAAVEALKPGAPFVAGDWCGFCPGKFECEARSQQMMETHLADFEDLEAEEMPNFKVGQILDKISAIRKWLNDIEERGMSEVQKGHPVTGKDGDYKLVEGRSNRCWKDQEVAEARLRKISKLKVSDIFAKPKLLGPSPIEKLLGKKHPLLKELVEKPPGKPVLVSASDPRKTLQVKAEDEFEDLDNDANAKE